MPKYSYIAKSFKGQEEQGTLEAKNKSELARALKKKELSLISAELGIQKQKGLKMEIGFLTKVSLVEKIMFTRNLKVMISAGIPLPRSLELLAKQAKSKKFSNALLNIRDQVVEGKTFSQALEDHSKIFSPLFSSMVKVGEAGGRFEEVLELLTKQMTRKYELGSKIQGAMVYPAVIIIAMIGIGIAMLLFVVPQISKTFKELKIDLPKSTQFVITLGDTLAAKWYLVIIFLVVLVVAISRALKTQTGKKVISFLSLKLPIISGIMKKANSAHTTRTLGSLISAGVPLARSLEIIAQSTGNFYYKKAMEKSAEKIVKGEKLSDILLGYSDIYPTLVIQMISVGEETGQTSEILDKLADFFEEEVANSTKNISSVIEPFIMLLVGGAIGFFAISMVQPMYSMLDAVQ